MNPGDAPAVAAGDASRVRVRIRVRGAVQGVGFRPFVYRRALALELSGWVRNSAVGVVVEAEGEREGVARLIAEIRDRPPAHAVVAGVGVRRLAARGGAGFEIRASRGGGARSAGMLPDLATCEHCLGELFDPTDRRYRYPFINCTQCGPRYSILAGLPYDRVRTAMRGFALCARCLAEYRDPASRRFHAEPTACPDCGPQLAFREAGGRIAAAGDAALRRAVAALRDGAVIAVKGIGGFHLFVDARDSGALTRLRAGKGRARKPFAVLFPDLAAVRRHCRLDAAAEVLLTGPARPIVLLPADGSGLAPEVAPDGGRMGAMLPYAPVHHLLLAELGFPLVATSANRGGEPIATTGDEVLEHLTGCCDGVLDHDRPILRPIDDSVAQLVDGRPQLLRSARGFAPAAVPVAGMRPGILAFGGHLKCAVALSGMQEVTLGQHLGDAETAAGIRAQAAARADLIELRNTCPVSAACDLHPDYAASRAAVASGLPVVAVQHHVAHVAACLAEHGRRPPALGVAWDGSGYGPDGTVWGGEFLRLTAAGWRRVAHLRGFPLPGGSAAVREPRRAALGLLYAAFGPAALQWRELAPVAAFRSAEREVLAAAMARGLNTPITTSAGRLFDAWAALCGLVQRASYEGQAAALLEQSAGGKARGAPFVLREGVGDESWELDWQPALEGLLAGLRAGMPVPALAAALHLGLAEAIVAVAMRVGEPQVVLSGGCFQNVRLSELAIAALRDAGFEPLWHARVPPNDGGIALGQAVWAHWQRRGSTCV